MDLETLLSEIDLENTRPTKLKEYKAKLDSEEERKKLEDRYTKILENREVSTEGSEDKAVMDVWKCESCKAKFEFERGRVPLQCKKKLGGCGKDSNHTNFKALSGPYQYFDLTGGRKTFIPKLAADDILGDVPIATRKDSKEIYFYDENYYTSEGEDFIRSETQSKLMEETRENRKKEVVNYIIDETLTDPDKFNKNDNLVAVKNGVLHTGERGLKDPDPENDIITHKIPVEYDSNADFEGSRVSEVLGEIFYEEDLPSIQRFLGTLLEKNYDYRKILILHGPKRTGKSLFLDLIKRFLGSENTSNQSLQDLSDYPFSRENLVDKLANIRSDLDNKQISDTGIIKELSGGDPINAPRKHIQGDINFTNYAKLMFSCNTLPQLDVGEITDAFWDRFLILKVNKNRFSAGDERTIPKEELLDQLTQPEEKSALLNWILEGLEKLKEEKHFKPSERIRNGKEEWISHTDNLRAFVNRFVVEDEDGRIVKKDFREAYRDHCHKTGRTPLKPEQVGKKLPKILPFVRDPKPKIHYEGSHKQMKCWEGIRFEEDCKYTQFNRSVSDPRTEREENKADTQSSLDIEEVQHKSEDGLITESEIFDQADPEGEILLPELTEALDLTPSEVKPKLKKMVEDGKLSKMDKGVYRVEEK